MDNRFVLLLDVETANDTRDSLVYDLGYIMTDLQGNIYEQGSYVVRDIFVYERELMKSAYYARKIPEYVADLQNDERTMIDFMSLWRKLNKIMTFYNCNTVAAYNCSFDRNALNTTLRFISKSKYRWFFPYNTEFICIWNMACNSICQRGAYKTFAETYRHYSNHGKNYRATAETVYAFLTNNPKFNEEHKGLDDVLIEQKIFLSCLNDNIETMGINRGCWQKVKRGALALR